jgi:hypothetical protein
MRTAFRIFASLAALRAQRTLQWSATLDKLSTGSGFLLETSLRTFHGAHARTDHIRMAAYQQRKCGMPYGFLKMEASLTHRWCKLPPWKQGRRGALVIS